MFRKHGLNVNDLDLWQFYGYMEAFKEEAKQKAKVEYIQRRTADLLFGIGKSLGTFEEDYEDFFSGYFEIDKEEGEVTEKRDSLETEGKWEMFGEEKEWIYNMDAIRDLTKYLDKLNPGGI